MPRGKRKYTREQMIERLTKEINFHQSELDEKSAQLNALLVEQKQEQYAVLEKAMADSGKSVEQVVALIKKAK